MDFKVGSRTSVHRGRASFIMAALCLPAAACATAGGEPPSAASVTSVPVSIASSPRPLTKGTLGSPSPSKAGARYAYAAPPTVSSSAGTLVPRLAMPEKPTADALRHGSGPGAREVLASYQKVGSPYQVAGTWYLPAHEPDYDEKGTASWYGDAFQGRPTANGELFDVHIASAAHPTLPIPSFVEVTNLENGKKITVRLNDRGPFVQSRIIDLSQKAAELLGYTAKGTANVRVRYLGPAPAVAVTPQVPFLPQKPISSVQMVSNDAMTFIQAGAFSKRENADAARERAGDVGPARIAAMSSNGTSLFRVLIGPWSDPAMAERKVAEATAMGFNGARLVTIAQ